MVNRIKAIYQQIKYLANILFFLPNTFFKRVVFGSDPVWKAFFFQSWGRLPEDLEEMARSRKSIWINTEAGGEITQIFSLCRMLKEQFPEYNLLISTHKYNAYLLAQRIDGVDYVFFSPWDITWVVRKVLRKIKPKLLMAIEIVTAPVLFREAYRLGFKTFLCSAFMSKNLDKNRILKRAMPFEFYKHFDFIAVKDQIDKEGFEKLGCPANSVKILGNLKYDTTKLKALGKTRTEWLKELGLETENKVLLGGSIHPGEEKFLIDAHALLRKQDPQFRLIIAPRFTEFICQAESYLTALGLGFIKRTEIKKGMGVGEKVIILDTFGELAYLYAMASYALIGSSIIPADPLGGHNIIEPMVHETPIFYGPYMLKAREVVDELKECWQGMEIRSSQELAENILFLEKNKVLKDKIQEKMREIVNRHKDSAERHVMAIKEYLSNTQTD
jgi:3-deoxy-D-manno-octulosonic-acid transferase